MDKYARLIVKAFRKYFAKNRYLKQREEGEKLINLFPFENSSTAVFCLLRQCQTGYHIFISYIYHLEEK